MHLIYVANTRFPTEKAHGLATAKICEAFAESGIEVDLVVPRLWRGKKIDPFAYYGIKPNFRVIQLPTIDLVRLPFLKSVTFLIQIATFSFIAPFYCWWRFGGRKNVIYFSHDYLPLVTVSFIPKARVYYDIHHFPGRNLFYRRLMRRAIGFAVQTKWKVGELGTRFGILPKNIMYWPNGTDVEKIIAATSGDSAREEARIVLKLPRDRTMILYLGSVEPWKGVETLITAVPLISEDADVYIVGPAESDVERIKNEYREAKSPNLHFVPFQNRENVLRWLTAADVLVLPNTGRQKVAAYYTSPMKLFEYMAAGRPIVASDLPAIREIVDEATAYFAVADNPASLADAINRASGDATRAHEIARKAQETARSYTWTARAERIRDHIHSLTLLR